MAPDLQRILVYTHNSIGMGHAFRTLAVITGIKYHRPDIDFLVLTGSSIPCLFLDQGIDVVKLPSIKKEVDKPGAPLRPRYLTSLDVEALFEYRQRVILETFELFSPDVVMIEHYMAGLMNEALPLIQRKRTGRSLRPDWLLVHLSRGICPTFEFNRQGCATPPHGEISAGGIDTARLFDLIYVFEDPGNVDSNHLRLGSIPNLRDRIHYLGPIAVKAIHELPPRDEVIRRLGLPDKRILLLSLGRHGPILQMAEAVRAQLCRSGFEREDYQIVMTVDPYLDREIAERLNARMVAEGVHILPFSPYLIDLVNISELVICRAGYNTVNEVILTGVPSIVIPERHPGGEQEHRARAIRRENVRVADEVEILNGGLADLLRDMMSRKRKASVNLFDKYAIGRRMLRDFEERFRPFPSEGELHGKERCLRDAEVS